MEHGQRRIALGLALISYGCGGLDILSYKFFGEVFPSAMTGNLALMGLALGQGHLGAATRNMTAFAGFVGGVVAAAAMLRPGSKGRLLVVIGIEIVLLGLVAVFWGARGDEEARYALIVGAATAMGLQSGVAHRIGLPSITTTYFTGTTVGLVFGLVGTLAPRSVRRLGWPLLALLGYVIGAVGAGWAISGRAPGWVEPVLAVVPCAVTVVFAGLVARYGDGRAAHLVAAR